MAKSIDNLNLMKPIKNKFVLIESDGSLKICSSLKLKISNNYFLKETDYKTLKNLDYNTVEKNLKSKYRKVFF